MIRIRGPGCEFIGWRGGDSRLLGQDQINVSFVQMAVGARRGPGVVLRDAGNVNNVRQIHRAPMGGREVNVVSPDRNNVQVYGRRLVEADIALPSL